MIAGTIVLEDLSLVFAAGAEGDVRYTVCDMRAGVSETRIVHAAEFFAALSIAVHNDGYPNAETDYPAAESVQPTNPDLRWIP